MGVIVYVTLRGTQSSVFLPPRAGVHAVLSVKHVDFQMKQLLGVENEG